MLAECHFGPLFEPGGARAVGFRAPECFAWQRRVHSPSALKYVLNPHRGDVPKGACGPFGTPASCSRHSASACRFENLEQLASTAEHCRLARLGTRSPVSDGLDYWDGKTGSRHRVLPQSDTQAFRGWAVVIPAS